MLIHANTDDDDDNPTVHSRSTLGGFPICHENDADADDLNWVDTDDAEVNCVDCIAESGREDREDRIKVVRAAVAYGKITAGSATPDGSAIGWFGVVKLIVDAHNMGIRADSSPDVNGEKLKNAAISLVGIRDLDRFAETFAQVFDRTQEHLPRSPNGSFINLRPRYVILTWKLGEAWKIANQRGISPADWTFPRNVEQARLIETGTVIENTHFARRPDADEIRAALAHLPREERSRRGVQA